mgnify:FL=1
MAATFHRIECLQCHTVRRRCMTILLLFFATESLDLTVKGSVAGGPAFETCQAKVLWR